MAVPLGWLLLGKASGRAGRAWPGGYSHAAGSLVLRRMDRWGLVRAKKHGTKSGTNTPLRRDSSLR